MIKRLEKEEQVLPIDFSEVVTHHHDRHGQRRERERKREMNLTGSSTRSNRCGCSHNCLPSTVVALA